MLRIVTGTTCDMDKYNTERVLAPEWQLMTSAQELAMAYISGGTEEAPCPLVTHDGHHVLLRAEQTWDYVSVSHHDGDEFMRVYT